MVKVRSEGAPVSSPRGSGSGCGKSLRAVCGARCSRELSAALAWSLTRASNQWPELTSEIMALQLILKSDLGARQLVLPPRHGSQEPLLLIRHEAQNQLFRHQPLHHPFGVQVIVLAPARPVVALGLAQVECARLLEGPLTLLPRRSPEQLQCAPHRPPVLGGRFHDDFLDLQFHQPLGQHAQFAGGGAEFTAFKLILACPFHVGHDNCQHPLVNVNGCYSIRHHASPWRRGEHAKRYSQAGSRGYRSEEQGDERRPIIRAEAQHAPGSNRPTISTSSLSNRPHRSHLCHDPSFSWDFAGRRPIQTDQSVCPTLPPRSAER